MYLLLLPISVLFVLAAAVVTPPEGAETTKPSTPATVTPAESKAKAPTSAAEIRKLSDTYFKLCMQDWGAASHMTKKEWQRTCRRTADERAKFRVEEWVK